MTNVKMTSEREILAEAQRVLWQHLGPAKTTRFWIAIGEGTDDYLKIKESLFEGETVDTLYDAIRAQEDPSETDPADRR